MFVPEKLIAPVPFQPFNVTVIFVEMAFSTEANFSEILGISINLRFFNTNKLSIK